MRYLRYEEKIVRLLEALNGVRCKSWLWSDWLVRNSCWRVVRFHLVTTSIQHLSGSSGSIGFAWMWCMSQHLRDKHSQTSVRWWHVYAGRKWTWLAGFGRSFACCYSRFGLKVSNSKTEVQCIGKDERKMNIKLATKELKQSDNFVYLGGVISADSSWDKDVARRICKVSGVVRNLDDI